MAKPTSITSPPPKAIIVGGGPVGLLAALSLARAGIDFLLLEQRSQVIVNEGSDMTLLPMTMPMLDQLNLMERLSAVSNTVHQIDRIDHSGRGMGAMKIGQTLHDRYGNYPWVISRRDFLHTMYESLPTDAREKILVNKKLHGIEKISDGVCVTCKDGMQYRGTFVIGADGAHSMARECMQKMALKSSNEDLNSNDPFIASYQALWIRFPTTMLPGCKPGMAIETHGTGTATQLFAGTNTATVAVYRRLADPSTKSSRYSEEDQVALVKQWAHLPLLENGSVSLQDAYNARTGSGLVDLEEGVLSHWSWDGRIVLVGDAAHKFTPSMGSGMNFGLVDVVTLLNEIHTLSQKGSDNSQHWWESSSLNEAFQIYQEKRLDEVKEGCRQSGGATAMATWANTTVKLVDQYLIPSGITQWLFGLLETLKARKTKPVQFAFG